MKSIAAKARARHDEATQWDYLGAPNRAAFFRRCFEGELAKTIQTGVNADGDMWAYLFPDKSKLLLMDDGEGGTQAINAWRRHDKEWFNLTMEDTKVSDRGDISSRYLSDECASRFPLGQVSTAIFEGPEVQMVSAGRGGLYSPSHDGAELASCWTLPRGRLSGLRSGSVRS